MSKSILQEEKECFLCRMAAEEAGYFGELSHAGLHRHHAIFGRGNREKSEHYGLWVWLCVAHHEYGPEAVHKNRAARLFLSGIAQQAFMEKYPDTDFREEFGINYLDCLPEELENRINPGCGMAPGKVEDGFSRIETGLEDGMPF